MSAHERKMTLATSLWLAVSNADDAVIDRLLAAGADANVKGGDDPALITALNLAMFDVADRMIAHGADVNFQADVGLSCPPLVPAIMRDIYCASTARVEYLLSRGAKLNIRFRWAQEDQCTPRRLCQLLRDWKITNATERETLVRIERILLRAEHNHAVQTKLAAQRRRNPGPKL